MRIGYWLRRFFRTQAHIDNVEGELRGAQNLLVSFRNEADNWRQGKGVADQVTNTLQFRVNEYFAENEVMRGFITKKCGKDALKKLAKDFMEAKK